MTALLWSSRTSRSSGPLVPGAVRHREKQALSQRAHSLTDQPDAGRVIHPPHIEPSIKPRSPGSHSSAFSTNPTSLPTSRPCLPVEPRVCSLSMLLLVGAVSRVSAASGGDNSLLARGPVTEVTAQHAGALRLRESLWCNCTTGISMSVPSLLRCSHRAVLSQGSANPTQMHSAGMESAMGP